MNIIDSTALIEALKNNLQLTGEYVITSDLDREFEVSELAHQRKRNGIMIAQHLYPYDEAYYLRIYDKMLNKYGGCSLVAMRNLGDISILALVEALIDNFGKPIQTNLGLFMPDDGKINVFTADRTLRNRLVAEFGTERVIAKSYSDLK